MKALSQHQLACLRDAASAQDGTVLCAGHQRAKHAFATGKSLTRLGYLAYERVGIGGFGHVFRITEDGRAASVELTNQGA